MSISGEDKTNLEKWPARTHPASFISSKLQPKTTLATVPNLLTTMVCLGPIGSLFTMMAHFSAFLHVSSLLSPL
jgi:hypothetical protein